ncbi:Sulfatase, partial [Arachidicoccus rhizosphaerae]
MKRSLFAILGLMSFWAVRLSAQTGSRTDSRPNILIIVSDDHAYQSIGTYGSPYGATPHIDKLASEGATYYNAFVTNSLCGPSRACLLTSKYSNLNGFEDNFSKFDPAQPTFASYLTDAGYQTAWIGKWHLGSLPQHFSYFNIVPEQGYYYNPDFIDMNNDTTRKNGYITNVITDLSENWLKNRDTTKPFCLVIG